MKIFNTVISEFKVLLTELSGVQIEEKVVIK